YVVGETASTNFPTSTSLYPTNSSGLSDVFVAKLGSAGTNLVFSTYLGGNGIDIGFGIALDSGGNVYLTGVTTSTNFPVTTNAVSPPFGGSHDAFVVKLTASDSNLVYSTFLGGSGDDRGQSVAVDSSGNAIVVGVTASVDFPVVNAIQTNFAGGLYDIFVTK